MVLNISNEIPKLQKYWLYTENKMQWIALYFRNIGFVLENFCSAVPMLSIYAFYKLYVDERLFANMSAILAKCKHFTVVAKINKPMLAKVPLFC